MDKVPLRAPAPTDQEERLQGAANPAKVARKSVGDISKHLDKLEQSERADKSKRDDDSDKEDKVWSTSTKFILFTLR